MKISIAFLLVAAAAFTVAQVIDYPDIPDSQEFHCVKRDKAVFDRMVGGFLNTFSSVSSGANNLLLNIIDDVPNTLTNTGVSVVTVLLDAINLGTVNGGPCAASIVTILIQAFETLIAELHQAVTNILGYLGPSGATIQANLVTTIYHLDALLFNLLTTISYGVSSTWVTQLGAAVSALPVEADNLLIYFENIIYCAAY